MDFGSYFRGKRLERKLTLRSFCKRFGFDTAYISRLENNKMKPPEGEKLTTLADALDLKKNSAERVHLFDLAYQAKDKLPQDIKSDAKKVISLLPAFLRTSDGKKISKSQIDRLVNFLEDGTKEERSEP